MQYLKKVNIRAWTISAVFSIVFVVLITIVGELFQPIKNWLSETFSHHWIGKSVISVIIFIILGFLFNTIMARDSKKTNLSFHLLFWITVLGVLTIIGFYTYEAFFALH